ncbi:DUF2220 family protein [Undibacterium amnicola]|nr:DUF2220 family protein [Undibacterium amnicola]
MGRRERHVKEEQLFKRPQENHLQDHLRLEQEHVRFSALLEALAIIQKA